MSYSAPIVQVFDLLLGIIGFLSGYVLHQLVASEPAPFMALAPGMAISILTFWFCTEREETDPTDGWVVFIEQVSLSTGLNLIIQALLTYFQIYKHIPLLVIFSGGLISSALLVVSRQWMRSHLPVSRRGVLMVGFDAESYRLALSLRQPVIGVLGSTTAVTVPTGLPVLGPVDSLAEVVARKHPSRIVVSGRQGEPSVCSRTLLECRLAGIAVNDLPSLHEKLFYRVSAECFAPADFVLSPALTSNRSAMAIQAIYTNLIGLFLLVALLPFLTVIALAIFLFCGRGPILEGVECLGFQNIPFQRFRFRTHRTGAGRQVPFVGRLISRLRLEHLPQLINVVRGEMALVGPHAVRTEFAERLTELMPFYSHRFTVKPGIFGWARLHMPRHPIPCETARIDYDLYYVKEGSPALDLEILLRFLFGRVRAGRAAGAVR